MMARRKTGEYSHDHYVINRLREYAHIAKERRRAGRYMDVAYVEGYMNGLQLLLASPEQWHFLPKYYVFGPKKELRTVDELRKELPHAEHLHKKCYEQCRKHVERLAPGVIFHHTPFLY